MTSKMPRRGRGTLHIIAGLLVASAIVRVGASGAAIAEAGTEVGANELDVAQTAMEGTSEAAPSQLPTGETSALLEAFQQREARLAAREAQLIDRLQALRVAEEEVTQQLAALKAAEESLAATIARADVAAEADLEKLVAVYENMKPKDAAELFQQMSPQFAAGFLGMMNSEAAALIMSQIPPDVSHAISVVLAGRNANVPTE